MYSIDVFQGELFGLENLLKFKDGSFMSDIWRSSDGVDINNPTEIIDEQRVGQLLKGMSLDEMNKLGDNEKVEEIEEVVEESSSIQIGVDHRSFLSKENGSTALINGLYGSEQDLDAEEDLVHAKCILESNKINDEISTAPGCRDVHPSPVKSAIMNTAAKSTTLLGSRVQKYLPNEKTSSILSEQDAGEASNELRGNMCEGELKSGNDGLTENMLMESSFGSETKASASASASNSASHEESISGYLTAKSAASVEEKSLEDISEYSSNEEKANNPILDVPPETTATAKEKPKATRGGNAPIKKKANLSKISVSGPRREQHVNLMGVSTSRNAKQTKGDDTDFLSLLHIPSYMKRRGGAKRKKL
mmetsp:Transcript_17888/g.27809  ORF Transcript_17888/g.27809 Transcript_17888/m.27809 type:complete len:364 (+) Transcript_17888:3402-4493(+)